MTPKEAAEEVQRMICVSVPSTAELTAVIKQCVDDALEAMAVKVEEETHTTKTCRDCGYLEIIAGAIREMKSTHAEDANTKAD